MKYLYRLLLAVGILLSGNLYAQQVRVTGRIVDAGSAKTIAYATLRWTDVSGKTRLSGSSDSSGVFSFAGTIADGKLIISCIGYQPDTFIVRQHDMGALALRPIFTDLEGVTIISKKQTFVNAPDKKVFNVASNLAALGGTVGEAFRQIPGVTVSSAGKLSLRNGEPVILLDGKRTNLTPDQIPADQVESIEIITNPSAKYDAQGNSGIINIISKKNRKKGINGSLNANWTSMPEYNVSGDLNVSKGPLQFNVNVLQHGHQGKYYETLDRINLKEGGNLHQYSSGNTKGPFTRGKASLDYQINANNSLTLTGLLGGGDFKTRKDQTGNTDARNTRSRENFRFGQVALGYLRNFKKEGEKISADVSVEKYRGPEQGTYFTPANNFLQQYDGGVKAHTIILQTDYTRPFREGKGKLESGIRLTWHKDHNQNVMNDYDTITGKYVLNTLASYNFLYKDPVYAAYANYSDSYGKFSYMAGIRFEQYTYDGEMIDSGYVIRFRNPGLYPSVFLTQKLDENKELHLNYSRRVNRPGYEELSPRTDFSNSQNLFRGNQSLQSESTNLVEFSYNQELNSATLTGTVYMRNINRPITPFTTTLSGDTLLTTYVNGKYKNTYGLELFFKSPLMEGWSMMSNANLFNTDISAGDASNTGLGWFAKVSVDGTLPAGINMQLSGTYEGPKILPQGRARSTGAVDIALKRDFLKKKNATVTLSLTDIFNTDRYFTETALASQFSQEFLEKYTTRVFKVNVNYRFGVKDKNLKQHSTIESMYDK